MVLRASDAMKKYKKVLLLLDLAFQKKDRGLFYAIMSIHNELWFKTGVSKQFIGNEQKEKYKNLIIFFNKRKW